MLINSTITKTSFTLSCPELENTVQTNIYMKNAVNIADTYKATIPTGTTSFDYCGTYRDFTTHAGGTYLPKAQALPDKNFSAFAEL
ncbi:hypothetical protein NBT05_00270 [Aquimarina sp. ERC-38]|uniref:hypothetical protein n=1 Tax=Aquimarina sp. ERC-38 TaxID=2949996 RepID=UPI0022461BF2|nr:hypothetical protein [Aquimarina sp. ERC-38]UZO80935.1 hypothetical protein NBT05_00270 [Aquimarina sp. ERC-38]